MSIVSAGDQRVYLSTGSGKIYGWDVATSTVEFLGDTGQLLTDIAIAPDSRLFGIDSTSLYLIDTSTWSAQLVGALQAPEGEEIFAGVSALTGATGLDISLEGVARVSSNNNSVVGIVDLNTGQVINDAGGDLGQGVSSAGDIWFLSPSEYAVTTTSSNIAFLTEGSPFSNTEFIVANDVFALFGMPEAAYGLDEGTLVGITNGQAYSLRDGEFAGLGAGFFDLQITEGITGAAVSRSQSVDDNDQHLTVIYSNDFSTDPGWTTDQPDNFQWQTDGSNGFFSATTFSAPTGSAPSRYAYETINLDPTKSFSIEWDQKIESQAGTFVLSTFGLTTDDLAFHTNTRLGTPTINPESTINFGTGRIGSSQILETNVRLPSGESVGSTSSSRSEPGADQGVWYSFSLDYDQDSAAFTRAIFERDTGEELFSITQSLPGSFASSMVNLGVSMHGFGYVSQRTLQTPEDNQVTHYDNIVVRGSQLEPDTAWSISPTDVQLNENSGTTTFSILRSNSSTDATVFVSTVQDLGSNNNNDYGDAETSDVFEGIQNKQISFAAGETTKTVQLAVNDDTQAEGEESFRLVVQDAATDPIAVSLASTSFTIIDDDFDANTVRISVASDGTEGNADSTAPAVSDDGGYVAFTSFATNLVSEDTGGFGNVFIRDRQSGETQRVSVAFDATSADGNSIQPSISSDGRYVSFASIASNLVTADTNDTADIFVHDRLTGETERVSVATDGTESNSFSVVSYLSGNGRYVAFDSNASNLVDGDENNGSDVFVHDRLSGETERVSVATGGTEATDASTLFGFSKDGRYVAFNSFASNLVDGDTTNLTDIFVHDRLTGETNGVPAPSDGSGSFGAFGTGLSEDGRYILFEAFDSNEITANSNVFVYDRLTGGTERVSVGIDGAEANDQSADSSISADGRYAAFLSLASNLVAGDDNGSTDLFVHDRLTSETALVALGNSGELPNDLIQLSKISSDGSIISFSSAAGNLVSGDQNFASDVFVVENPLFADADLGLRPEVVGPIFVDLDLEGTPDGFVEVSGDELVFASDPDGDLSFVRFSDATPGTDGGSLALDGSPITGNSVDVPPDELARVSYQAGPNAGTNEIAIEAFDAAGNDSNDLIVQINVTDPSGTNSPPVLGIGGPLAATVGQTTIFDFEATDDNDTEGDGLTYSITGGADGNLFDIGAEDGVLTYTVPTGIAPNADSDSDGIYEVDVQVSDSGGLLDQQSIDVEVSTGELSDASSLALEYFSRISAYGEIGFSLTQLGDTDTVGDPVVAEGWRITHEFLDGTFRAVVLERVGFEPVIAFRGTVGDPLDWLANAAVGGVGFDEIEDAWASNLLSQHFESQDKAVGFRDWVLANPGASFTGHSQGGAQAQLAVEFLLASNGVPTGQIITFNSPGIEIGDDAANYSSLGTVLHYISAGDIVSLVGDRYTPGDVIYYDFDAVGDLNSFALIPAVHSSHWAQNALYNRVGEIYGNQPIQTTFAISPNTTETLGSPFFSHLVFRQGIDREYQEFIFDLVTKGGLAGSVAALLGSNRFFADSLLGVLSAVKEATIEAAQSVGSSFEDSLSWLEENRNSQISFISLDDSDAVSGADDLSAVAYKVDTKGSELDIPDGQGALLSGNLSSLDGLTVVNFNPQSSLFVENEELPKEVFSIFKQSAIIQIDKELDGETDTEINLIGDFNIENFEIENRAGGTEIRYIGNENPVFIGDLDFLVEEGALEVGTISAQDVDSGSVSYKLAGSDDDSLFAIDAGTGAISFLTAPDFDDPSDSDQDNVYDVTVEADDGDGGRTAQAITVTVEQMIDPVDPVSKTILSLWNADTDTFIRTIEDGDTLLPSEVGDGKLTLVIEVPEGSPFFGREESIKLNFNDGQATRTENVAPYALFGDRQGIDFGGKSDFFQLGENTLSLEVFDANKGQGNLLGTVDVSFSVIEENVGPIAADDTFQSQGSSTVLDVLQNDSDPNPEDTLSIVGFTQPDGGEVVDLGGGSLVFTPDGGLLTEDTSFEYTIEDNEGAQATAIVTLKSEPEAETQVSVAVSIDGEAKGSGKVDVNQKGRDNDLEIGNGDITGLLFDDVEIASGAAIASATLVGTSQRNQSGNKTLEVGIEETTEGLDLLDPLTDSFDFVTQEDINGSFAKGAPVELDVTDIVAAVYNGAQASNTDGTYDFRFALKTEDGVFRLNPEEFGEDDSVFLHLDFV